jgi:hypothetical protein
MGSSGKAAMAMAPAAEPGADVVTSNQASMTSSVAVAAAGRLTQGYRRIRARPVVSRPNASIPSSPVHAAGQCAATAADGSVRARMTSHGIIPIPAATSPRPSQARARGRLPPILCMR